jgi:hypothetical protein
LSGLDLAALLRIFSHNWNKLKQQYKLYYKNKHFLEEMFDIRNRWAHKPIVGYSLEDVYRDFDTIQLFLRLIDADIKIILELKKIKLDIMKEISNGNFKKQDNSGNKKKDELSSPDMISEIIEKCVIIKIFNETIQERGSIYEAVRWYWRNSLERAECADYVLAVEIESKRVIGIYKPTLWYCTTRENAGKYGGGIDYNRIAFIGEEADDNIKKKYLDKMIPDEYIKGQASFRYNRI